MKINITPQDIVKMSVDKVTALGKVDKFTEGVFKIPVKIINEPEGGKINSVSKGIEIYL